MEDIMQEKSRGLKFAEQQLLRHGWEHGKGLGRAENGISEAIRVKVKSDKGGVGHKEGEQFTFHWWDHVFNKASSSLQVESDPNGIQLKKTAEEDEEDGRISNKKPRKAALAKDKLYGCFVKSATLLCGEEQPEPKSSVSDHSSSSDEEEDQKLDLSSAIKLSDADLMKACGGRTAHKGARHGLTMSAKLARLEQQEAEFMAKYGKKSQPISASPVCVAPTAAASQSADQRAERQQEKAEDSQRKKLKKKKSSERPNEPNADEVPESTETGVKPKKKKHKASEAVEEIPDVVSSAEDVLFVEKAEVQFPKKKRKQKKRKNADQTEEEEESSASSVAESPEETPELHADTKIKKKKKKKSSKNRSEAAEEEESNDTGSSQSEPAQDRVPKSKKRKAAVTSEEAEVTEGSAVKLKRKKCKKNKPSIDNVINQEPLPPKKKKKKSRE